MIWKPGDGAERAVKREHPVLPRVRVAGKVPRGSGGGVDLELTLLRADCSLMGWHQGWKEQKCTVQSQGGAWDILETVSGLSDSRVRVD